MSEDREKQNGSLAFFGQQAAAREQVVARFEQAWQQGDKPRIEDYLLDQGDAQQLLLQELVYVELECRLKAGEAVRVEAYLRRFPTLAEDDQVVLGLICDERRLRSRVEAALSDEEYLARFPQYRDQLTFGHERPHTADYHLPDNRHEDSSLQSTTSGGTFDTGTSQSEGTSRLRQALHVRCPHCHKSVEILDDTALDEIICDCCGSSFTLVGDETLDDRTNGGTRGRPRQIGRFQLNEQLGTGAVGTVWWARDPQLDREVAVKVPRKGSLDQQETEKFLREARAAAQLCHPNIVSVHEVGIDDKLVYIVSDFVRGVTLKQRLTQRGFTPMESAAFCLKLTQALGYAHDHGVIHRDLKPSNIIIDASGEPHIVDFGLARREAGEVTMTFDGQVLGTPAYMSPEQAKGEGHAADRRSDIYSLGVILFELLTGELPFRGNMQMLLKQLIEDDPPSPRRLNNQIPPDLETICLKCLEKTPTRRHATMKDLAAELEEVPRWRSGQISAGRDDQQNVALVYRHPDSTAQVAGVYTVLCGILFIAWALEGLVIYGTGIDPSPDARSAMLDILLALTVVYVPLLISGFCIIRGNVAAIWLGFFAFTAGGVLVICGLTNVISFSGVFSDSRLRIGLMTLLGNQSVVGMLFLGVALLSRLIKTDR